MSGRETVRIHKPAAGIVPVALALAALLATTPAEAQQRRGGTPRERGDLTIAISGGRTRDAAEAFAEDVLCPDRDARSWAGRAGYRLTGGIIAQAVVAYHTGQDEAECVDGLIPPVPPTGPYTRSSRSFDDKYRGYPFVSTEARLALELPLGRSARARAFGGMGVIWEKDVPIRLLGAELHVGGGTISAFAEAQRWWHEVPRQEVTVVYLDGQLQSHAEQTVDVGVRSTLIRIGLELSR